MAEKLDRVIQLIFGRTGSTVNFGQIGSKTNEDPVNTKDLDVIQALDNYEVGLIATTSNTGSTILPYLEDWNSFNLLVTQQLKYLFQHGAPEWHVDEDYYKDVSIVINNNAVWMATAGINEGDNIGFEPALNQDKWLVISTSTKIEALSTAGTFNITTTYNNHIFNLAALDSAITTILSDGKFAGQSVIINNTSATDTYILELEGSGIEGYSEFDDKLPISQGNTLKLTWDNISSVWLYESGTLTSAVRESVIGGAEGFRTDNVFTGQLRETLREGTVTGTVALPTTSINGYRYTVTNGGTSSSIVVTVTGAGIESSLRLSQDKTIEFIWNDRLNEWEYLNGVLTYDVETGISSDWRTDLEWTGGLRETLYNFNSTSSATVNLPTTAYDGYKYTVTNNSSNAIITITGTGIEANLKMTVGNTLSFIWNDRNNNWEYERGVLTYHTEAGGTSNHTVDRYTGGLQEVHGKSDLIDEAASLTVAFSTTPFTDANYAILFSTIDTNTNLSAAMIMSQSSTSFTFDSRVNSFDYYVHYLAKGHYN